MQWKLHVPIILTNILYPDTLFLYQHIFYEFCNGLCILLTLIKVHLQYQIDIFTIQNNLSKICCFSNGKTNRLFSLY